MGRAYKGNNVAVVSVIERGGRVRSQSMVKVTSENLKAIFDAQVDAQARLMDDEHPGYLKPGRGFRSHETVCHSREEYARGGVHTLQQYLGKFDFRYNTRLDTDGERTVAGLRKAEGKQLMLHRHPKGA